MRNEIKKLAKLNQYSKLKYLFLFLLAGAGEIADLIGNINKFGMVFNLIADLLIFLFLFLLTEKVVLKINEYIKKGEEIMKEIKGLEKEFAPLKIYFGEESTFQQPNFKKSLKKINYFLYLLRKRVRGFRNPRIKILIASLADLIPFLDLFPLRIIAIYLNYKNERGAFKEFSKITDFAIVIQNKVNQIKLGLKKKLFAL